MMNRMQSFLQQEQVQVALSRVSALARQWEVQENISKIPPLLRQWQVQESISRFYQSSILPYVGQVNRGKNEEIGRSLDGIIAQKLDLKTASTDQEEKWKIDAIKWLNDGEVLLRDNMPHEYRRLTAFAVRISPYTDRDRLQQIIDERLQMLVEVRKRRRTSSD